MEAFGDLGSMLGRQKQRKRPKDEGMIQVLKLACTAD